MLSKTSFPKKVIRNMIGRLSPKTLATIDAYKNMHYIIDLKHPKDLDEKILWLTFNSDTTKWSELADKYAVRYWIKEKGYEDILVSLYGVYDKAELINYDVLPNSFILKTNHGSGTNIIVEDKEKLDKRKTNDNLNKWLNTKFGWPLEPHYLKIKPKIIAEELLIDANDTISKTSLIDYKVFCLDGKPKCILVFFNRTRNEYVYVENHFTDWSFHPETQRSTDRYRNGGGIVKRPHNLDRMLQIAEDLSKGFPQVRIDFYEVNNKLYFGEMTFTSNAGCMVFFTKDFLLEMGQEVTLDL